MLNVGDRKRFRQCKYAFDWGRWGLVLCCAMRTAAAHSLIRTLAPVQRRDRTEWIICASRHILNTFNTTQPQHDYDHYFVLVIVSYWICSICPTLSSRFSWNYVTTRITLHVSRHFKGPLNVCKFCLFFKQQGVKRGVTTVCSFTVNVNFDSHNCQQQSTNNYWQLMCLQLLIFLSSNSIGCWHLFVYSTEIIDNTMSNAGFPVICTAIKYDWCITAVDRA